MGARKTAAVRRPPVGRRRSVIVCVTGMPGCGKEEVARIAERMGFSVVRMGDVVREEAARRRPP